MTYVELVAVDRIYPPKKLMGVPLEDWPMNQLLNYKAIQNKTLLLLNDEKKCKQLKRALKKARSNTEKVTAFTQFANLPMISMQG